MRNDILIREVRVDEFESCADVIRQSFATVAAEFDLTEQNCPTNGAFLCAERLAADRCRGNIMAGLFVNGEPAGFAELSQKEGGAYELGKLAVLPRYRHKGYGARLLEWARVTVRERGGNRITIGIIEENTVLKDWYAEHGFVHTGTHIFPRLPFTVGFMELEL